MVDCTKCTHFKRVSVDFEVGYCDLDPRRRKIVLGVNNIIPDCPYFNRVRNYSVEIA